MGLFQNLKEATEQAKQAKETKDKLRNEMIITTAFTLDEPFETIGLVHAVTHTGTGDMQKLIDKLKENAIKLGAEAIIGFHAMEVYTGGFHATEATTSAKFIEQTAYGTAIRYKKEMQG